jgi:hypothetical protein
MVEGDVEKGLKKGMIISGEGGGEAPMGRRGFMGECLLRFTTAELVERVPDLLRKTMPTCHFTTPSPTQGTTSGRFVENAAAANTITREVALWGSSTANDH